MNTSLIFLTKLGYAKSINQLILMLLVLGTCKHSISQGFTFFQILLLMNNYMDNTPTLLPLLLITMVHILSTSHNLY